MLSRAVEWFDQRTGFRELMHEALYENIPGGARWRYVWGSTLVFVFTVQVISGIFLWMAYSPSAQTAWESVYFIQFKMSGGWLLRGIHHYAAQAMVVLLGVHLAQVVIDGAYKAPREVNFWLGLILLKITLGLALTGYLLPWDQKGYWATQVATKIAGIVPIAGPTMQKLVVGGNEYGHLTLTRFFALHAGVLPGLLIFFLVLHIALFRRHGIHAKRSGKRSDQYFWPDQVLKDAVMCLVVLLIICGLAWKFPAELGAPADGVNAYDAARPEWYFLFLFQFLKFFHGEVGEIFGAIVVPGILMLVLFMMPIIGRVRIGHVFNVVFLFILLGGAGYLTYLAWNEDYIARGLNVPAFENVERVRAAIAQDLEKNKDQSPYFGKDEPEQIEIYYAGNLADVEQFNRQLAAFEQNQAKFERFKTLRDEVEGVLAEIDADLVKNGDKSKYFEQTQAEQVTTYFDGETQQAAVFQKKRIAYDAYRKSLGHIAAVHQAEVDGHRARVLAEPGIPPAGALTQMRNDPKTAGRALFKRNCGTCHNYVDPTGLHPDGDLVNPDPSAPNLYGFGGRAWVAGLLDPKKITSAHYFGFQRDADGGGKEPSPLLEGQMVEFIKGTIGDAEAGDRPAIDADVQKIVVALSAQADLKSQAALDKQDAKTIAEGETLMTEGIADTGSSCIDCHKFKDSGDLGSAPDLTGYASRQWLIDFVSNPGHERFYGYDEEMNGMPAFLANPDQPESNLLDAKDLAMIVDWLRGDWYEPAETSDHE